MADEEDGYTDQTSSKANLWMVYLSTFVAVCSSFEFGSCAIHHQLRQPSGKISLTLAEICIGSFSAGMGAVPWVVKSEIFPIYIKGVAGSLATLVNWFGAWAVSYTFNFLVSWSSCGTFILYAAINALGALFVITMVPETKGKTLEQIQAAINA